MTLTFFGCEDAPSTPLDASTHHDGSQDASFADGAVGSLDAAGTDGSLLADATTTPLYDATTDQPDGDTSCAVVRVDAELTRAPVDIVWAIDGSPSMWTHSLRVTQGLYDFTDAVEASGTDMRVAVLGNVDPATGASLTSDVDRYLFRQMQFDGHELFEVLLDDFEAGYGPFLRLQSPTHLVVVSDSSNLDSSGMGMTATQFRSQMQATLGGPFHLHAIAPSPDEWTGTVDAPQFGDLASATGGERLPITSEDWSPIFERVQASVVQTSRLPCDLPLPDVPGADLGRVQVLHTTSAGASSEIPAQGGQADCGQSSGWHYDDAAQPRRIVLCPASCDDVKRDDGGLDVKFECVRVL